MRLSTQEAELHTACREVYAERINAGVAREQARKDLPLSTYTEAYWKIDLHNLLHFFALRMDMHAQEEIRQYANTIAHEIVSKWVPLTWEAFVDYRLNALSLSATEVAFLGLLNSGQQEELLAQMQEKGWLKSTMIPGRQIAKRQNSRSNLSGSALSRPGNDYLHEWVGSGLI